MSIQTETARIIAYDYGSNMAYQIFQFLDINDQLEAVKTRGLDDTDIDALQLFIDWHNANAFRVVSLVACKKRNRNRHIPFAVIGISMTGQAGVAAAALLAREHFRYRRELAELAILINRALPTIAAEHNIHRIEARSWVDHPTAGNLLQAIGFTRECTMPGFGVGGMDSFDQYARSFPPSPFPPQP